jgi:hypothetical protein
LVRKPIDADDFQRGTEMPECEKKSGADDLEVTDALLDENGTLDVSYEHSLSTAPDNLALAIRNVRESSPLKTWFLPNVRSGQKCVSVPDSVWPQLGGALAASLVAHYSDTRLESVPTWVVQPHRLTHIPSDGNGGGKKSRIEESGEGLPEFLDELAKTEGIRAVIDYLKRLNIRFFDGEHGLRPPLPPTVRPHDPFRPDIDPEWLKSLEARTTLAEAIIDFVERHQKRRLREHAARGNINGLDNFVDIFTTITRLVWLHYRRRVITFGWLIPLLLRNVDIATVGYESTVIVGHKTTHEASYGYLDSLADNLKADKPLLRDRCRSRNIAGHIRAALLIAQVVRFNPDEQYAPKSPSGCHPDHRANIKKALKKAGLKWPTADDTMDALRALNVFEEAEEEAELAKLQEALSEE